MKFRVARILGVALLYLFVHLGLSACSGSQQDEQGLEVSDQNENSEQVSDQDGQQQGEEDSQQSDEDNLAQEDSQDEDLENENLEEGDDESELAEDETESDLQEIIQEMNSQQEVAAEGEQLPPEEMVEQVAQETQSVDATMAEDVPVADAAVAGEGAPFQPGGTPAGQGLPEMGSKLPYIVQAGDTLAKISTRIFGDSSHWREMADLSGMANPSRIYPGDVVYYSLTDQSLAFATAYENVPRGQETVQAGDTLSTIASRVYGSQQAWKSIWRQNDTIDNPDKLEVGMTVYYVQSNTLAQAIQNAKAAVAELIKSESNQKALKVVTSHTNTVGFSG